MALKGTEEILINELKAYVSGLRNDLNRSTAAWINGYQMLGGKIHCANRCGNCCSLAVNCTWPESLGIADCISVEASTKLRSHVVKLKSITAETQDFKSYLRKHRQLIGPCPFLADCSCSIYTERPLSCRALLSTKESYWCGADFGGMANSEKQSFMASLDRGVVDFPMHYVAATREFGQNHETEISKTMMAKLGFAIYGNLPLLTLLNIEYDFADTVIKGYEATMKLLEREGLYHPYLITLYEKMEH